MQLFRAAFHDSAIPQAIVSIDGSFIRINQALCGYLGRDEAELMQSNLNDLAIDADKSVDIRAELEKRNYWITKRRYIHKDGTLLRTLLCVSGIHDNGVITKVLVQLQDQSETHDLWGQLQKKQEEVEQFAYIASHDLREPLATMAGYASLLQKRCAAQVDDTGKRWLEEISNCAKRMEEKIDDLLDFSRAGRTAPKGTFNLEAAIEEARRTVVLALKETEGEINFIGENPAIRGDRSMVAQVFQNLFSNSIKYRGVDPPRIEIKTERQEDMWCVEVRDNGLGFDMQFKDRIFGVFQRLYTVEYPGTGIGLALAKKIVEHHEGRIWTESSPGEGASFYFTLPAAT